VFNSFFSERNSPDWRDNSRATEVFENYMMHAVLREADRRGLTYQFHTGIQEGNGNVIVDANPVHMTNLFLEYGDVKFDIFHMGYPYLMELGNLAKNFANVHIDMCWGHIISPEAARRGLIEWLDAVPANKINAFGGDYCFVDGVYGHQYLARRNVVAALAQKISDGSMDLDRAKEIAGWLFVDNPMRLFGLRERVGRKT
jgi:predicted TIM-barrel fold metal-dependent hydrolase